MRHWARAPLSLARADSYVSPCSMDDLVELDRLSAEPFASPAGKSSSSASPEPRQVQCSASKRRRRFGPTFVAPACKVEEDDMEKMQTDMALADAADLNCSGCFRSRNTGRSWLNPTELIEWAFPDRRGYWRKACYTCWRTVYHTSHTLNITGTLIPCKGNSGLAAARRWRSTVRLEARSEVLSEQVSLKFLQF